MSKQTKKRLCWNCEGNISLNLETCPFCGVSVVPATLEAPAHGFTPPYQMGLSHDSSIPRSPYLTEKEEDAKGDPEAVDVLEETPLEEFKRVLLTAALLLSGTVFFLFAFVLLLFSQNGVLTLQWDASGWFIYGILSLPMLFFGWRTLLRIKD